MQDSKICGIVYANSFDGRAVNQLVWDQFDKQRSRGVQGFGFFNGKYTVKAALEKRIKHKINSKKNQTDLLLFHHRFPTSTENVKRAAHPFSTGGYFGNVKYVLVHNGVITNAKTLYDEHQKLKKPITYQSLLDNGKFNDSEALLWDLALTIEGKQDALKAYGGIAFIAIKLVNNVPQKLYFGKNAGRPLKMKRDESGMFLSSEGEGEDIKESRLYTYNYKKRRLTDKFFRIPSYNPSYTSNWNYGKSNGYSSGYNPHNDGTSTHTNHVQNVCSTPDSGIKGNPVTTEVNWMDICEEDDFIFDSSGNPIAPWEVTFYEDGSYDLWNDTKENWESGYWLEEEFKANNPLLFPDERAKKEKAAEKKFFDFIATPKKKAKPVIITSKQPPIVEILKPSQEDVALRIFNEIGKAHGLYDVAFFNMEEAWVALEEQYAGTLAPVMVRKEIALLREAMHQLEHLPDYVNEDSLHPLWKVSAKDKVAPGQTNFLALPAGGK